MSESWTFIPSDDETGDEVWCEDCGLTVAPTEPCFRTHLHCWAYLCTNCAGVRLDKTSAP